MSEIFELFSLCIPRHFVSSPTARYELHGFCDANEQGYGAVIYLRTILADGINIQLILSKVKVALLKSLILPRLELCAAVLLVELLKYVHNLMTKQFAIEKVYAWFDSTIVLAWIHSSPHRWKTFMRNRVVQIQDRTESYS